MEKELTELFDEIRLTYNLLAQLTDNLHTEEGVTVGMRAVMEFLQKNGPHTVPEIARARGVTRQRIQILANELIDTDLVTVETNPAHKRSSKLSLSETGTKTMARLTKKEASLLNRQTWPERTKDIASATRVIRGIRGVIETLDDS